MERDYGKEIDILRQELSEIKQLLTQEKKPAQVPVQKTAVKEQNSSVLRSDPNIGSIMEQMKDTCYEKNLNGAITHIGFFASGDQQSTWIRKTEFTHAGLQELVAEKNEKFLSCIGNRDRMNILLALLKKPMTVAELVEECHLNSTGQAYHHMQPLLAVDLIKEDSEHHAKGVYVIQSGKVEGIITLLISISNIMPMDNDAERGQISGILSATDTVFS